MALFTDGRLIGALGRIISILEENRELLKENRDLLKSSDEYFKERKRLDGLHAERLAREDMERRLANLVELCRKRWRAKYTVNGQFVLKGRKIIHEEIFTNPSLFITIGCVDGLWYFDRYERFDDMLDRSKSFKSPEDAAEAYLVSERVT